MASYLVKVSLLSFWFLSCPFLLGFTVFFFPSFFFQRFCSLFLLAFLLMQRGSARRLCQKVLQECSTRRCRGKLAREDSVRSFYKKVLSEGCARRKSPQRGGGGQRWRPALDLPVLTVLLRIPFSSVTCPGDLPLTCLGCASENLAFKRDLPWRPAFDLPGLCF